MPPCENVREESRCSAELQTRLDILPQLQEELNKKDGELSAARDDNLVLRNKFGDLEHKYETAVAQCASMQTE